MSVQGRGLTVDCGEGKHDVCCGFGTSSYLIPQTAGERFECACPCHDQPAAKPSLKADLRTVAAALVRTDHTRRCEGFYRCTCIVGEADAALKRIEEALSRG